MIRWPSGRVLCVVLCTVALQGLTSRWRESEIASRPTSDQQRAPGC
jgi:hypothetical protein